MSKLFKLILFLVLAGLSIILSTAIVALQYLHSKKKAGLKKRLKENYIKSRHETNLPKKPADHGFGSLSVNNPKENEKSASKSPSPYHPNSSTAAKPPAKKQSTKASNPLNPHETKLRNHKFAPDSNSPILIAESHLGLALRDIPFEVHDTHHYAEDEVKSSSDGASSYMTLNVSHGGVASGSSSGSTSASSRSYKDFSSSSLSSKFGGNAIPIQLRYGAIVSDEELESTKNDKYSNYFDENENDDDIDIPPPSIGDGNNGIKRTGVEFVKLENPNIAKDGNINEQKKKRSLAKASNESGVLFSFGIAPYVKNFIMSFFASSKKSYKKKRISSSVSQSDDDVEKARHVLYHLQKASELGNHHAQNLIANSLASGILPINNDPTIRSKLKLPLNVTSDFSSGDQLRNAILLWHMSAMEGNIESLMALGYRHFISATSKSTNGQNILVHDIDLKKADRAYHEHEYGMKNSAVRHSAQESDHYGVLGTCESSLAYYEEAVNQIMDELESGPLRGKVTPAQDTHILPEIRQRGSSSALTHNNKPDELDEAIKFMETRALKKHDTDVHSAYKLATMYHYGIRGAKQDMKKALHYYEICASKNSWECAGQAGKFYLFGMGMEDDERDLIKAFKYFKLGMPGGVSTCEERLITKQLNIHQDKNDDDEYDGDDDDFEEDMLKGYYDKKIFQCDHPSVNGMGLLYLFGIPHMIKPNLRTAVRHFELANKMGNMDAMYNLAMLKLGWMNPYYDELFQSEMVNAAKQTVGEDKLFPAEDEGPFTGSFMEAMALLTKSAELGHLQAKHRVGMIYSRGFQLAGVLSVRQECKKALSVFKGLATTAGTTVTKRMRAAYKQYMAGDYESSVRNYLAAAETGSIEAQVNAAYLLEEGHCLGMNHLQCMKASVRLWRAAAKMGHEEACLKVGDFYFYGKLREDIDFDEKNSIVAQRDREFSASPLPWTRYILYPEDILHNLRKFSIKKIRSLLEPTKNISGTCRSGEVEEEGTCKIPDTPSKKTSKEQREHFKIAAKYYRTAATELNSSRGNFNLGFMYEWGLGLSQDFPMAKRYYDLAAEGARSTGDGALANQIALFFMRVHEHIVKMKQSRQKAKESLSFLDVNSQSPTSLASGASNRSGIIIYHILTWESVLILLFSFALVALIQHRNPRRQLQN